MKKLLSVLAVGLLVFAYACGGGGDDPKSLMDDMLKDMEALNEGLNSAETADDIVKALDGYTESLKALAPRVKAMKEKHKDIDFKKNEFPEEFKEYEAKFKDIGPKLMAAMMKASKFMQDPKVQEAQKRFGEAMMLMQ